MSEGSGSIFRGIRPVDWVLAGALTALGVWLMVVERPDPDANVAASIAAGSHGPHDDIPLLGHGPALRPRDGPGAVVASQRDRRDRVRAWS